MISKLTFGSIELRADIVVEKKRRELSKKISTRFKYKVQQGPFKNMILSKKQYWGVGDNGNKSSYYRSVVDKRGDTTHNSHNAKYDVKACARCLFECIRKEIIIL